MLLLQLVLLLLVIYKLRPKVSKFAPITRTRSGVALPLWAPAARFGRGSAVLPAAQPHSRRLPRDSAKLGRHIGFARALTRGRVSRQSPTKKKMKGKEGSTPHTKKPKQNRRVCFLIVSRRKHAAAAAAAGSKLVAEKHKQ